MSGEAAPGNSGCRGHEEVPAGVGGHPNVDPLFTDDKNARPRRRPASMWRLSGDSRSLMVSVPRCGEPPTRWRDLRDARVCMTSRCSGIRCRGSPRYFRLRYDLEAALAELTESVTAVLGLFGGGVTMADDRRLRYVTTVIQTNGALERNHLRQDHCPCRETFTTGEVVRVKDLREESTRWPEISVTATARFGPRRLGPDATGRPDHRDLNLYSTKPREWSDADIALARELADVATSYAVKRSQTAPTGTAQRATAESAGVTGRDRTDRRDHRLQTHRLGRSGLPAHAPTRPQQEHQHAGGRRSDSNRRTSSQTSTADAPG